MNIANLKFLVKNITRNLNKETILACALAFPFVVYAFIELCIRIVTFELAGTYHIWDTYIYWAVGRGIVNGIVPWSGLWEIKPPGIFLLSAISFKIFDSPVFTHYFQAFVLLLTAAVPIVAFFLQSNYRSISKLAFAMLAGLMLALYSGERAGEVQVESFGAAFACIAVFAMAMPDFEKRRILWTSIATIGILGACGFKEPFLFPLFGVSLILCANIKTWFFRFALPLIIAVVLGIIFLLIFGWMDDFLHYLNHMSSAHISRHGSAFRRAMQFTNLYNDLNAFSWGLAIAILAILSLPLVLFFANTKQNENSLFIKFIFFGVAFFLSVYSVGLGGEFYNHHYVFALPFYMALVLLLLKNWNGESSVVSKLGLVSFLFLVISTLNLPDCNWENRKKHLVNLTNESVQAAAYLDSKMDELGVERYTFLGGMGAQIYGWSKHSPSGPYFMLQNNFFGVIPGYGDSIISNVRKADIVVVAEMHHAEKAWNEIAQRANEILSNEFTEQQMKGYKMYFRKNKVRQ